MRMACLSKVVLELLRMVKVDGVAIMGLREMEGTHAVDRSQHATARGILKW